MFTLLNKCSHVQKRVRNWKICFEFEKFKNIKNVRFLKNIEFQNLFAMFKKCSRCSLFSEICSQIQNMFRSFLKMLVVLKFLNPKKCSCFSKFCSWVKNRLRISKNVHVSKLLKGFPNFQEMIIFLRICSLLQKGKLKFCSHC